MVIFPFAILQSVGLFAVMLSMTAPGVSPITIGLFGKAVTQVPAVVLTLTLYSPATKLVKLLLVNHSSLSNNWNSNISPDKDAKMVITPLLSPQVLPAAETPIVGLVTVTVTLSIVEQPTPLEIVT